LSLPAGTPTSAHGSPAATSRRPTRIRVFSSSDRSTASAIIARSAAVTSSRAGSGSALRRSSPRVGAVPTASAAAVGIGGAVVIAVAGAVTRPLAVARSRPASARSPGRRSGIGAVIRPVLAVAGAAANAGGSVSPGARIAPRRRRSRTIATARSTARPVIRIRSLTEVAPSNRDHTKYSSVPNPAFIGSNRGFCRSRRLVAPTSGISVGTTLMATPPR
jgi:hypothetical protein